MGTFYSRVKEDFTGTEFIADLVFSQKATVMCFDQCHSRSVGKARTPLAFLCRFRRRSSGVRVYTCVFDGKWGEDPTELPETELITSSHYPPGGWVWDERCSMHHTGCPTHSVGFLEPFVSALRCKFITQQTYTLYTACWDFKATENEYLFLCWLVSRAQRKEKLLDRIILINKGRFEKVKALKRDILTREKGLN